MGENTNLGISEDVTRTWENCEQASVNAHTTEGQGGMMGRRGPAKESKRL
jgi:hypothetical protein